MAFDSGAFSLDSFDSDDFDLGVAVTCDVRVSWLSYDSAAAACDVRVSWLAYDANASACDVKVSWLAFDSAANGCDVRVSWLCYQSAANDGVFDYIIKARRRGRR